MPACLLDKNVVRAAVEGIGKAQIEQPLTPRQRASLELLLAAEQDELTLYISIEMRHILDRYGNHPDVQVFLRFVEVLRPTRYFKRWARWLREHGFTREDAKVLALATFGTDPTATRLGANQLLTFDQALINHFEHQQDHLRRRLKAMTVQLAAPYDSATLPDVGLPHELPLQDLDK